MKSKKRREQQESKARSTQVLRAFMDFTARKESQAKCPVCNSAISVTPLSSSAWSTTCECGKCNDTLRGL